PQAAEDGAAAASAPPAGGGQAQTAAVPSRPAYHILRYQEDYRFLADFNGEKDAFDPIKYIRLGPRPDFYLSLGGQGRSRYEYFRNGGFSAGDQNNDFMLFRGQLHADLHLSSHFRAFAQLSTLHALDPEQPPSPLDNNDLDLQQGFGEARLPLTGERALWARIGRQEVVLGSGRLVAIRKGPNFRRSFDMLRLGYAGPWRVDLMAGAAVRPEPGVFDDGLDEDDVMWSAYSTGSVLPAGRLSGDAYYIGTRRTARSFTDAQGRELRHSLGTRLFGAWQAVDYNFEAVLQLGRVDSTPIRAWTVASDSGYRLSLGDADLRLGVKANAISGDRSVGDGRLGTFDALYPNLKYFSEAGLIVPSNLIDLHPGLALRYGPWQLKFDWDVFWRYSTADAVYGPPGVVVIPAAASDARFISHQTTTELILAANRHVSLTFYYVHAFRGAVMRDAGLGAVDFFGTWVELIF
ncbi:MAG: alginate export family protein, partial [Polyangiales bacterium]